MYQKLSKMGITPFRDSKKSLSLEEIQEIESLIHFSMPEDYRDFLLHYNGGKEPACDGTGRMWFFPVELPTGKTEEIIFNGFLGYHVGENNASNLLTWYDMLGYEYEGINTAIIGLSDPGEIVLVNEPDEKGVYLWDDSLELETSTADACMYKLANTFTEFVHKILVEVYDHAKDEWTFM